MATLAQVRDKADAKLVTLWNTIETAQDAYFAKNGRYFQMLKSPEAIVADGLDSDFSQRLPNYEDKATDIVLDINEKIPFQLEIQNHHNEKVGHSFTAIVTVKVGDSYYRRKKSNKTASGLNHTKAWYKLIEGQY